MVMIGDYFCSVFVFEQNTGMVKKTPAAISFIHDRSKINDGSLNEWKSAISHAKESKGSFSGASYILNPQDVLSLLEKIPDEVQFLVSISTSLRNIFGVVLIIFGTW